MRKFWNKEQVAAAGLPAWQAAAVAKEVGRLEEALGAGFSPDRGCVLLVEPGDGLEDAIPLVAHPVGKVEATERRHGCLVGLTLWGNSGDGVTWVCPERPGHAEAVQEVLRRELCHGPEGRGGC